MAGLFITSRWKRNSASISTGSALGLGLADSLKEFGLVNHSIWIEEELS